MEEKKENYKAVIVIPTWDRLDLLKDLFESLKKQTEKNFAVVICDNGSRDQTFSFLEKEIKQNELNLWALMLPENFGFATANNVGINFAFHSLNPEFIILLNNDALPNPNFVEILFKKAAYYDSDPKLHPDFFPFLGKKSDWRVGSFAPLIENFYHKEKVDAAGIKIYEDGNSINRGAGLRTNKFKREEEVFGPTAASAMYLGKALKDIALPPHFYSIFYPRKAKIPLNQNRVFRVEVEKKNSSKKETLKQNYAEKYFLLPLSEFFSSRYFAYFEDVDLAMRLRLRFWGSVLLPTAKVLHKHSATAGSFSPFKSFHIHRNQYFNLIRDFPSYHVISGFLAAFRRYFHLLRSVKIKKGPAFMLSEKAGKFGLVKIVLGGWVDVLKQFFGLVQERYFIQSNRLTPSSTFYKMLKEKRFRANLKKMVFETPNFKSIDTKKTASPEITASKEQKKSDEEDKDQLPEWF